MAELPAEAVLIVAKVIAKNEVDRDSDTSYDVVWNRLRPRTRELFIDYAEEIVAALDGAGWLVQPAGS